ncbi:unnamed protein product [Blepharisma stoltei]|uniref:RRM domain-containing protein n=1 Tax=Blepharisma stoltei TaxID=1481888 RepID=A0AAU9ITL6_9CILI|nr:unnamed protein product [Blepharisma stoltei]
MSVFIGNLPDSFEKKFFEDIFRKIGPCSINYFGKFAFIEFNTEIDAYESIRRYNGKNLFGKIVRLEISQSIPLPQKIPRARISEDQQSPSNLFKTKIQKIGDFSEIEQTKITKNPENQSNLNLLSPPPTIEVPSPFLMCRPPINEKEELHKEIETVQSSSKNDNATCEIAADTQEIKQESSSIDSDEIFESQMRKEEIKNPESEEEISSPIVSTDKISESLEAVKEEPENLEYSGSERKQSDVGSEDNASVKSYNSQDYGEPSSLMIRRSKRILLRKLKLASIAEDVHEAGDENVKDDDLFEASDKSVFKLLTKNKNPKLNEVLCMSCMKTMKHSYIEKHINAKIHARSILKGISQ